MLSTCALLTDYSTHSSAYLDGVLTLQASLTLPRVSFSTSPVLSLAFFHLHKHRPCAQLWLFLLMIFLKSFWRADNPFPSAVFWLWLHSELPLSRDVCTNLPKLTSKVKWSHLKKKWGDIATLRVILVTFTKYLLCSKFLSLSLHWWVFRNKL